MTQKNMKDDNISDQMANVKGLNLSSDSQNVSIETDLRVFKGAIKGRKENEPIQDFLNFRHEITNININISNSQLVNNLCTKGGSLTKLILPNFQDLQSQIGLNINNNINTCSSRQPADISFREAIKMMYKKIEISNEQKFQGKGVVDLIESEEPPIFVKLNELLVSEAKNKEPASKSKSKKRIEILQPQISQAIIQESPLHKICAPISYKQLDVPTKKINSSRVKSKLNTKSLPKKFLQTLKNSLLPSKDNASSKILNKPISQIECVLSTKTRTKSIFVTNKEFILSLDNILLKSNLDNYIGNNFVIHIHHLNPQKELLKNASAFQKKFSKFQQILNPEIVRALISSSTKS